MNNLKRLIKKEKKNRKPKSSGEISKRGSKRPM
jgi:hypothetical protein